MNHTDGEKLENEKMRKWENEKMECKVKLEEWSCASEIKQILNKIKATPCKTAKEINFAKVSNFGKVCTPKSDTSEEAE